MTTTLATQQSTELEQADRLSALGQVANHYAAQNAFSDYRTRKARNTISRQDFDLSRFKEYLSVAGATTGNLADDPLAWQGVTWGLVEGYVKWQLQQGDAIGSINVRLSTVKTYAKLAAKAGAISPAEYAMIRSVQGYGYKEGLRVDDTRETTRRGSKKSEPVSITPAQAKRLKTQPDTPQGRRDDVVIRLMLDLGLRVGEIVGLKVSNVNMTDGTLTFWREKVSKEQTHNMTNGLLKAMQGYIERDALTDGLLLRSSLKSGQLSKSGVSRISITKHVERLGNIAGIEGLSPHDLRHSWATKLAQKNTPIDKLMSAGGWSSPAMPLAYIEAAAIANAGIADDDD